MGDAPAPHGLSAPSVRTGRRRILAAGGATAFAAVGTVAHDLVQAVALWLSSTLGRSLFLACVAVSIAAGMGWVAWRVRRRVTGGARSRSFLLLAAVVAVGSGVAYVVLVAVPTELIHLPQYALLLWLLLPAVPTAGEAVAWTGLAGLADEAFQYWVLHRDWLIYLDFNDVVLNLLGAGLALVVVSPRRFEGRAALSALRLLRRPPFLALAALVAMWCGLSAAGLAAFYPREGLAEGAILLSRSLPPEGFWTWAEWSAKRFHILSPGAGALLSLSLLLGLARLGERVVAEAQSG